MKAISYYVQIVDVGRDQKTTELALKALDDVIRRFPDTRYARDAKLKLAFTRDHLAGKEMEIGRYYLKRGQYLAAMNRFKRVVDNYQTTTHVPEALERLVECDLALGLTKEAKRNAAVLGYNYPGSEWYGDAYALLKGHRRTRRTGARLAQSLALTTIPHGLGSRRDPAAIDRADSDRILVIAYVICLRRHVG